MKFGPESNRHEEAAPDLPLFDEGVVVEEKKGSLARYYDLLELRSYAGSQEERDKFTSQMKDALSDEEYDKKTA